MLCSLCAGALAAQAPSVDDLLADDWRVRNEAARALAEADSLDPLALVRVMQTEWRGYLPTYARYGGRGGRFTPTEPRSVVLHRANDELVGPRTSSLAWIEDLHDANELVVPWHPHDLASWLLRRRAELPDLPTTIAPTSVPLARAWLQLERPGIDELLAGFANEATAGVLAPALWLQGESGRTMLRTLLCRDALPARRAVLQLGKPELVAGPDELQALAHQCLHDPEQGERRQAGTLLLQVADRRAAAAALVAACTEGTDTRRRALGLLCLLDADAAPAAPTLLAHVGSDRTSRHRALVALATVEVPAALRGEAAQSLFSLLKSTGERTTRLLALDALGNCGDGVDAAMRRELQAMLSDPPFPDVEARLLGCLRLLGAVPELPTAAKASIAAKQHATTATWLALADDGIAGAKALARLLVDRVEGVDRAAVAERLVTTAPHVVEQWLDGNDSTLQQIALAALRATRPADGVSSEKLAAMLDREPPVADAAIAWLAERADARRFAPDVFAKTVESTNGWMPEACIDFARSVDLPAAQKLDMLAPVLRRGFGWQAVRGFDAAVLRTDCRRWLRDTEDPDIRARLLGELCRAGLENDEDIAMVRAAWGTARFELLDGLLHGPSLPPPIRADVEAVFDERREPGAITSIDWQARQVLLAHR